MDEKTVKPCKLPEWAAKSLVVAVAFVCGALFGMSVTAITLYLETQSVINQAKKEYYELGRDYERSIWGRFPVSKEANDD